jgi:ATP/maltotriose-dependent transcriptional regulator MalT/DNA-binding SARP family transcriptional activator
MPGDLETSKITVQPMVAEIPVSFTKIVIPTLRPEILHRSRLLALFDNLLDRKLIIIAAPAGYGKTCLLADFARQSEIPTCWLSLDSLDQDPQRFVAYLIASLELRFPKFGKQSKTVLKSLISLEHDKERILAILVNEISSQIDQHFTLVVDDYQFVDSVPDVRNLFSRFIYLVGDNCHIVLSSRRLPALPDITLMVARQQVSGFDLEELAFRPNEIRSLFEVTYGMTLDDRLVEGLMEQTEGWITGLLLSASNVAGSLPDLTRATRTTGVDLDKYLNQEVLAPQPPMIRNFLLQTSLLEEFNADLCEAVLGKGDWKNLIKTVRQNNLFVLQVGPDGKWLRYHHIFQEFLQERIRQEEPEKAQSILACLATVYEAQQEWEKAYSILRQFDSPDLLPALIERAGMPLLLGERLITLQAWLNNLPTEHFQKRPALLSLKGALLCTLGEGHLALSTLDQTIQEFQKADDLANLTLAYVRRADAHRLVGDYDGSLKDADEALRLSGNKPDLQFIHAQAERFKGVSLHYLGQIAEAVQVLEDALQSYERLGDKQRAAWVLVELGNSYLANGNFPAALNAYNQALEEWRRESNLPSQANVLNSLGVLYHHQGEFEQAIQVFESGLESARSSNSQWQESVLLASLGDMYVDLDEYDAAFQAYDDAAQIAQLVSYQFLTNYLGLAQAHLARLRGQFREAGLCLNKVRMSILATSSNYECGLYFLEHGCLQLVEDNYDPANADLEQALDYFQAGGLTAETACTQIWLAIANYKAGKTAAARDHLKTALGTELSGPLNYPIRQAVRQARSWLTDLQNDTESNASLVPWLAVVTSAESQLPDLRKRLRRLLHSVPIQVPHLVIQAFGKAQVRVNGRLVTTRQWKTASVRELFFFFLSASRPVTKEECGGVLWPEFSPQELKLRFKNELYRLRRALGQNVIRFENELYSFNRVLDYDYDVEKFNVAILKAKTASQLEVKISLLQMATSLRNGPYLQDMNATWVWPERERLDRICTDAWKELAESQRLSGDLKAALQSCQEALKIDLSREDIHCLAMQLHAEWGDRLGIIWQYQACREALRSELDVDPSLETEALYRRLIA